MRKGFLIGLILLSVLLVGCDSRVSVSLDVPIVVEPGAPRFRAEVDGYLSYDYRNHTIRLTSRKNSNRYYEPLSNAKVTVEEVGKTVITDRDGYFYMRGVPYGNVTIRVQHNWVGPYQGVYINTRSR